MLAYLVIQPPQHILLPTEAPLEAGVQHIPHTLGGILNFASQVKASYAENLQPKSEEDSVIPPTSLPFF